MVCWIFVCCYPCLENWKNFQFSCVILSLEEHVDFGVKNTLACCFLNCKSGKKNSILLV